MTERRVKSFSENGNIRVASPADLMQGNPAALIVNKESYARMTGNFTYGPEGQFESPQVVKVTTFSSEHGEVIKDFVLDGMTRTKFVDDNKDEPTIIPPNFKFTVKDVTQAVLQNPAVVPAQERREGQETLTMLQYLRAVIPPTVEHSQIATDRIAAHLINGWDNMVGEDLSRKYSALAALSLIGNRGINIATEAGLRRDLNNLPRLMAGETANMTIEERVKFKEQQEKLKEALVKVAAVILLTKLDRQEVARAAFMLVGAESQVIGGGREAKKQIYGLLYTPEVDRKLSEAFPNIGEREQMRQQLGEFISESFRRVGNVPNREEVINVLGIALRDPHLKFNHVLDVFTSSEPVVRYDRVREEINLEKLTQSYLTMYKLNELNPVEQSLVESMGRKTTLFDTEMTGLVRAIKSATNLVKHAEDLRAEIAANRANLVSQGVHAQLLDEAVGRIESTQGSVVTTTTLATLTRENQKLLDTIEEVKRKINTQKSIHKVGEIVDQVAGEKIRTGYGPQIRSDIIGLVIGEFRTIEDRNQHTVRQRIGELSSLDPNLLLQVKQGGISLVFALRSQRERTKPTQPTQPARIDVPTPLDVTPPTRPVEPHVQPLPTQPAAPDNIVIDRQQLEERRKQNNRERLNTLLRATESALEDIDLSPQDITDAERRHLNRVVRKLGQLAYNHPDTPDVMLEKYPHLQSEARRLHEVVARLEREITDRDTRTSR